MHVARSVRKISKLKGDGEENLRAIPRDSLSDIGNRSISIADLLLKYLYVFFIPTSTKRNFCSFRYMFTKSSSTAQYPLTPGRCVESNPLTRRFVGGSSTSSSTARARPSSKAALLGTDLHNMATDSIHQPLAPTNSSAEPNMHTAGTSDALAMCHSADVSVTVTAADGSKGTATVHPDGSFSFHRDAALSKPMPSLWSRLPCLWSSSKEIPQV